MIVVNMWFIKHTNGLFHYGLDYAEALETRVREIWVRSATLAQAVRERLPGMPVRVITMSALFAELWQIRRRGDVIFTPSSHPLALVSRQVVVVHDSFPFTGRLGAIKLALFRMGMALSRGAAAYINRADGEHFLRRHRVPERRTHYLPNRLSAPGAAHESAPLLVGPRLVIGLFGSDSPKKNYDALFTAFNRYRAELPVTWRIYGHDNSYTQRLCADYPDLAIEVVGSDKSTMDQFIGSLNLAVSAALGEGFARPVALALMRGTPTWLLDTPVFREFYADSARLFATVDALASAISDLRPGSLLARPRLENEDVLRADFERGVAWLGSR